MSSFFTDLCFQKALQQFPVEGKLTAVIYSQDPYYERLLRAHGANIAACEQFASFDIVCLLGSLKTLGIQSTNNQSDKEAMNQAKLLLKSTGLLYLSLPIGKDFFFPYSHRVYGEKRLKMLFQGWRPAAYFGYSYEDVEKNPTEAKEPVIILKPL